MTNLKCSNKIVYKEKYVLSSHIKFYDINIQCVCSVSKTSLFGQHKNKEITDFYFISMHLLTTFCANAFC